MIAVGEKLPEATLWESTEFGEACPLAPTPVSVQEAAQAKRVVIFGLPGAYTPTCSSKHRTRSSDKLTPRKPGCRVFWDSKTMGVIEVR